MLSPRAKRNISAVLLVIGIICIVARALGVVEDPNSGQAWFELCSIVFLTSFAFVSVIKYSRK